MRRGFLGIKADQQRVRESAASVLLGQTQPAEAEHSTSEASGVVTQNCRRDDSPLTAGVIDCKCGAKPSPTQFKEDQCWWCGEKFNR
jgi:hypothetical protein